MTNKKQLKPYSVTEKALAILRKAYKGIIFDMGNKAGLVDAKKARREIKTLRTDLDKHRKVLKAPLLEEGKRLDTEARRVTAELVALEMPIDQQIKVEETRIEAEKEAARLIEEARTEDIQKRITGIRQSAVFASAPTLEEVEAQTAALLDFEIEGFEELAGDAMTAKIETLNLLKTEKQRAVERQEVAEKAAADAAELAELRRDKEKRDAAVADTQPAHEPEKQPDPRPRKFTPLPAKIPFPGVQPIIGCIALEFNVSEALAVEWIGTVYEELS